MLRRSVEQIKEFTGISAPYEEPRNAEIVVETDVQSVEEIVSLIIEELTRGEILKR